MSYSTFEKSNLQLMLMKTQPNLSHNKTLPTTEHGQSIVEYGLILALIVLSAFIILTLFGSNLGNVYSQIVSSFAKEDHPGHIVVDVINEQGKGIANVRIYAFSASGKYMGKTGNTDQNGRLIFAELPDAAYKFRADYRNSQYWSNEIAWPNEWHAIVQTKERPFTLTVVDQAGHGLNNVRVYVFNNSSRYIGLYGNTNEAGQVIFNLPAGEYRFRADYRSYQYWSTAAALPETTSMILNTGQRPFTVTVVDQAGQGIENVRVYAFNASDQYVGLYANSDKSGTISFDLPDGSYKFRANYLTNQYWSETAATPAVSSATVLTGQQSFTVYVIDYNGQGIAGVRIYAFSESDRYTGVYTNANDNGLAIFDLSQGNYKFRADYCSNRYWSDVVNIPEINNTMLQTGQRPFTLTVTDAAGQGIAGVRVYAFTSNDQYTGLFVNTDDHGQGVFDLPDGSFKFRADYRSSHYWSEVISSPGTASTTIQTGQRSITVRVIDNQGSSMTNIPVYAFTDTDQYIGVQARTDASGLATLTIPNGSFKIRADYQGSRYWSSTFSTAGTTDVLVTIQP